MSVTLELKVRCKSPLHGLWSALSDTERLNRAIGNKPTEMVAKNDQSGARYTARTSLGGFNVTYDERPYEWAYLKRFDVLRKMHNGPVSELQVVYLFDELSDGQQQVTVRLVMTPRQAWFAPVVRLSAARTLDRIAQEVRAIDAALVEGQPLPRVPHKPNVQLSVLQGAHKALLPLATPALVDRLVALVREGNDLDVARIRPFELAEGWHVPPLEVLRLCLNAAKAGLLELRWAVICPSCRAPSETIPSLADLKEHGACQICDLAFAVELDDAVEATFAPSPAVRRVDEQTYCIGGPARTPHVIAQTMLAPGQETSLECPAEPGMYRFFLRGGDACGVTVAEGAATTASLETSALPQSITVAPRAELRVKHTLSGERHCKLERVAQRSLAASARIVTALPDFRRDFSSDLLKPGASFKLSRVALLFSDLASSTQMYSDAGDAPAYKIVQDHFEVVQREIEANGGAIIKTIGDAVMAVFSNDLDGVRAARAILAAFAVFRSSSVERHKTDTKIGVYGGPCFAVTANGVLDYFGQTVNVAARLQGEAKSGEFVVTSALAEEAVRTKIITEGQLKEHYNAALKGVAESIAVTRIRL